MHPATGLAHHPGERKGAGSAWWGVTVAVVAGALAIRGLGARGDLWLDQIWSIDLARMAGSAGGVFTLHQDNSHCLNALWLMLMGYDTGSLPARMLSIASGSAAVLLAEEDPVPDEVVIDPGGGRDDLVRVFPYAGLSGWDWYVYRRAPEPAAR